MAAKTGTFVVTDVDDESAVLADVEDRQVHPLESHPDLAPAEVLEATIAPKPPMEVVWTIESIEDRRQIEVVESDERPTKASRDVAADLETGAIDRRERTDYGEIHVLRVPASDLEDAVTDVVEDLETVARAARLGVRRVEVRAADGVLAVRYLP